MTEHDRPGLGRDAEPVASPEGADNDVGRRDFLTSIAMAGGLAAGYGTFFVMAGRFLYPSGEDTAWMYVSGAQEIGPGGSYSFVSPTGLKVVVTRKAESAENGTPEVSEFLALSSTCPHLGCRVHWEAHNDRFFCPCHNGAFDAEGKPIQGPPKADNQHLPRYPLMISGGLLFIEMPIESVGKDNNSGLAMAPRGSRRTANATGREV